MRSAWMSVAIVTGNKKTFRWKVDERNGVVGPLSAGVAPDPLSARGPPRADGSRHFPERTRRRPPSTAERSTSRRTLIMDGHGERVAAARRSPASRPGRRRGRPAAFAADRVLPAAARDSTLHLVRPLVGVRVPHLAHQLGDHPGARQIRGVAPRLLLLVHPLRDAPVRPTSSSRQTPTRASRASRATRSTSSSRRSSGRAAGRPSFASSSPFPHSPSRPCSLARRG